jgi:hypothetical protein
MVDQSQSIDWYQVRTMLKASLRIDWRGANNPWDFTGNKKSKFPPMLLVLAMNFLFSIMLSILTSLPDKVSAIVLGATASMLFVAFQILLEFGNILISPTDYYIIAPHPVSSRTFWVSKMLHLFVYVAMLMLALTVLPALVMGIAAGPGYVVLLSVTYAVSCVFAAVLVMNLYTFLMNTIGRGRMERILGYVQLIFMFVVYGGYFAFTEQLRDVLEGLDIAGVWWMHLLPPNWLMGWYRMVIGDAGQLDLVLASGGTVLFAVLVWLGMGNLSMNYAESLSEQKSTPDQKVVKTPGRAARTPWVQRLVGTTRPEDRVALLLTWSHFKHDMKFRLSILSAIPLVVLYLLLGWKEGMEMPDPFLMAETVESSRSNFFIVFAFAIMPMIFQGAVGFSSHAAASWAFHASPCDRVQLVLAGKRIVQVVFMLPAMLLVIGIFWWSYGNPLHAVMHAGLLYVLVLVILSLIHLTGAGLPFSAEKNASGSAGRNVMSFFLAVIPVIPFVIVSSIGYSYLIWAGMVGAALLLNYLLVRVQNRKLARDLYQLEYTQ